MATSDNKIVSIFGILAIVVVIGLVVYFVTERNNDGLDINIGLVGDAPAALLVA